MQLEWRKFLLPRRQERRHGIGGTSCWAPNPSMLTRRTTHLLDAHPQCSRSQTSLYSRRCTCRKPWREKCVRMTFKSSGVMPSRGRGVSGSGGRSRRAAYRLWMLGWRDSGNGAQSWSASSTRPWAWLCVRSSLSQQCPAHANEAESNEEHVSRAN